MIDGIINIRFNESATAEEIQAAVSQFYKLNENLIEKMDYKECQSPPVSTGGLFREDQV